MTEFNIITKTDSYKNSHWLQFPKDSEAMFSYVESRGGEFKETVMFGLRYILSKYLSKPITQENINNAEKIAKLQGVPFNREGWEYVLKEHNGFLPLKIKAIPEGNVVRTKTPLVTIESTDPKVFWIAGHVEPLILRIWYPITVATLSREIKKVIKPFVDETSDYVESVDFKLCDFGARAATSAESAKIAGMSHLVSFSVTDTIEGIEGIFETYSTDDFIAGSVPASEHSTITSWTKDKEKEAYENMIDTFGDENSPYFSPIYACVSDAYDIFNAIENIWGNELKQKLLDSKATMVLRPDSGNALYMVMTCLERLDKIFGHVLNEKGYKVLNKVKIIQGDGVDIHAIKEILEYMKMNKYSTDNITFGMGGALHQKGINRDTLKFALKCSAIKRNGIWTDVFKSPITDAGKISKKGLLDVSVNDEGIHTTHQNEKIDNSALVLYYENGNTFFTDEDSYQKVKERASV